MESLTNVMNSIGLGIKKNVPAVTPQHVANAVTTAGVNTANAIKQSGELVEKFQELVEKVDSAAKALDEKAPQIASVLAKNSGPIQEAVKANATALKPMLGGANIALIGGMPKSMIEVGATRLIKQAAQKMKSFSNSARKSITALKGGFRLVGGAVHKVKKNVRNTVKVIPKMVGGMNLVARKNGFKMPELKAPNLSPVQRAAENALNVVSNAAKKAGTATKRASENAWKAVTGSGRSSRKNRKNNKSRKNKKSRKN